MTAIKLCLLPCTTINVVSTSIIDYQWQNCLLIWNIKYGISETATIKVEDDRIDTNQHNVIEGFKGWIIYYFSNVA